MIENVPQNVQEDPSAYCEIGDQKNEISSHKRRDK